jgi:hypothetical protein
MKQKRNLLKDLENFEMHHKIISFIVIMITSIFLTRLAVMFHNPNPILLNFELHHFDYGIFLLLISTLLLLFGKKSNPLNLLLSSVAFGLVLDDLWFIRSNISDPGLEEVSLYNATFPVVVILVIGVILTIFMINYFKNKSFQEQR